MYYNINISLKCLNTEASMIWKAKILWCNKTLVTAITSPFEEESLKGLATSLSDLCFPDGSAYQQNKDPKETKGEQKKKLTKISDNWEQQGILLSISIRTGMACHSHLMGQLSLCEVMNTSVVRRSSRSDLVIVEAGIPRMRKHNASN